ncbi:maleylpyruvate isomerase family mycothiol-dependent enzyme [[Mycobacterium] crassicus]|uniref:Maleylpyruvate isomerase family mycothiol-dependent enzyme n=1 Tax=[Mycobacterium] crassicus TaxID=2872309 RepID=A0ABU5XKE2_9MYCO|nr:maleylpyruvate isomerase family mycothiol-dependent enzyme [Mycolicibacter sp. MYC098]MEB3022740.1 maleylpyruvate isomerase family mycothiol-dependent enzyme [Mycolicibacter sp. MYC098]
MTSPVATRLDKSEVLAGLFACWDSLNHLLGGLTEQQWTQPVPLPEWSVRDVVAHIAGTESVLLGIPTPESDLDVSTFEHVRNEIGAMNERWVRHLRDESGAELLRRFRSVTEERRAVLVGMSDQAWNAPTMTPVGPDSYGRFMRVRIFDCWMHELDIRDGLGLPASGPELVGPASRQALDEMAAVMGFVVGKLGGAPQGSRVAIELTGPLARTIRVAVDGRAAVVDDFGGHAPTAVIRMDGVEFTRVAGGRAAPGAVEVDGDRDVGARIVQHLNYVM